MLPYILLIFLVLASPFICRPFTGNKQKGRKIALRISMVALFFIFSLRAPSVGRDISGYKRMYNTFTHATLNHFNLYWTEPGYNLIELLAKKYLKLPWQWFITIIYGFISVSYYSFFKKYSENPTYSLLIYILLGYFVLDMSALRTALALSICLYAVPFAQKRNTKSLLIYVLLVVTAAQFQRGAYIFLIMFFVQRVKLNKVTEFAAIVLPIFIFFFRSQIVNYAITRFRHNAYDTGVGLGGSAFMYFSILIISYYIFYNYKQNRIIRGELSALDYQTDLDIGILLPLKMVYFGTLFQVFMGEIAFVRMSQFGLIFTTVLIPNVLGLLNYKSKLISYFLFTAFLAIFFYVFKVSVNELEFLPYVPFWNNGL